MCVMSAAQVSEQKKASKGTSSTTSRRRAGGVVGSKVHGGSIFILRLHSPNVSLVD